MDYIWISIYAGMTLAFIVTMYMIFNYDKKEKK